MRPAIEKKNLAMVEEDNSTAMDETGDDDAFSAKYIDESSRVRAVDLVKDLKKDVNPFYPATYPNRTSHVMRKSDNKMQN